jgi:hypothetical protein
VPEPEELARVVVEGRNAAAEGAERKGPAVGDEEEARQQASHAIRS